MAESMPSTPVTPVPVWRGRLHVWAFGLAALLTVIGVATVIPSERVPVLIYGLGMTAMFGASTLYHRGSANPWLRAHLRRIDHTAIYAAIAGTYTPVCLIGIGGPTGRRILLVVVLGAVFGIACAWSPWWWLRRVNMFLYVVVGWACLPAIDQLADNVGVAGTILIVGGGAVYTVGAIVLGLRRPDPWPDVFGFHEIFHTCTVVAASMQLVGITTSVLTT
jgi:hemolysin III